MQPRPRKSAGTAARPPKAPAAEPLSGPQASRALMVLGLLRGGARHGYELHRVVVAHGSLYADFKKPTLYHLLHRLAQQGSVRVHSESGARGPRGERLVFALTPRGEAEFSRLLRQVLASAETTQTLFEVAVAFMVMIPAAEAAALLRQRREAIRARRAEMLAETSAGEAQLHGAALAARRLATDHAVSLMDADIGWLDRAIRQFAGQRPPLSPAMARPRRMASR